MIDLASATSDDFATALKERFAVENVQADGLELELVQVEPRGGFDPRRHKRQAFALVFRGPMQPLLSQGIHALDGQTLGRLDIFLVPIGPDQDGMLYEAIFS